MLDCFDIQRAIVQAKNLARALSRIGEKSFRIFMFGSKNVACAPSRAIRPVSIATARGLGNRIQSRQRAKDNGEIYINARLYHLSADHPADWLF